MRTAAELQALLPEYVVGALPPAELAGLERDLAPFPQLRREADRLSEALVAGLLPALPPLAPSGHGRARLLAAVAGPEQYAPFWARIGELVDLPLAAVKALLARVDAGSDWQPGWTPGLTYFNFTPGPRHAGADAGFVRLEPGASFPRHRHLGHETTFVIAGTMREGEALHGPGTVLERVGGSEHVWSAAGARALITVSVHHGIEPC